MNWIARDRELEGESRLFCFPFKVVESLLHGLMETFPAN